MRSMAHATVALRGVSAKVSVNILTNVRVGWLPCPVDMVPKPADRAGLRDKAPVRARREINVDGSGFALPQNLLGGRMSFGLRDR